jgi:hypothetical protein
MNSISLKQGLFEGEPVGCEGNYEKKVMGVDYDQSTLHECMKIR